MNQIKVSEILRVYRYISLILTSLFYIIGEYNHQLRQGIVLITGMIVTAAVMDYLYIQNRESKKKILLLILIETLGNCMLLIPSGGLGSPYVWYIVNTIFIAGVELGTYYLWSSVVIYLISMVSASIIRENSWVLLERLNIIAGFILVAVAIELLVRYAQALEKEGEKAQEYLDYVMKLYETVYMVTSQQNTESLVEALLDYIIDTLRSSKAFLILYKGKNISYYTRGMEPAEEHYYLKQLRAVGQNFNMDQIDALYGRGDMLVVPIDYTYRRFGIICIQGKDKKESLQFIVNVSAMIFKKLELEQINNDLSLSYEQNRIANEIHDCVLQKLFGVSCNAFATANKLEKLTVSEIRNELSNIRCHVTEAMTELRQTIYGLSWNKEATNNLVEKLEYYVKSMRELHQVAIDLHIEGDLERLTLQEQKVIYRVSCEGIANGIRHGKAKGVFVVLRMNVEGIHLLIEDDGIGFEYSYVIQSESVGIGLRNMKQLVESLGGRFMIHSTMGEGTKLEICIREYDLKERSI